MKYLTLYELHKNRYTAIHT